MTSNTQLRNESLTGQMEKRKEVGRRIGDMHAVDEFRMKTLEAENLQLKEELSALKRQVAKYERMLLDPA